MKKTIAAATAIFAALAFAPPASAQGIELGLLDCVIEGGVGYIIGSSKDLTCTFEPTGNDFAPETYVGSVTKIGLDVGVTGEALMKWLVLAPTADKYAPGALAGDYIGASADASAAVGVGANLLVGGSSQSFTLQPLSVQAQTGINVAIGVSQFKLRSVGN